MRLIASFAKYILLIILLKKKKKKKGKLNYPSLIPKQCPKMFSVISDENLKKAEIIRAGGWGREGCDLHRF